MSLLVQVSKTTWLDVNRIKRIEIYDDIWVRFYMDRDTANNYTEVLCTMKEDAIKMVELIASISQGHKPPTIGVS